MHHRWLACGAMSQHSDFTRSLFNRLASMPLAIVLLIVLAIASVIGTVLQQNLNQQDYLHQFGPIWYWVFRSLGLFDMYHTWWFMALMGMLMVSLSFCLWRNIPRMLKEMRSSKVHISARALGHIKHQKQWQAQADSTESLAQMIRSNLKSWKWSSEERDGVLYLRADSGRHHKWGYIIVHLSMLIILIGGLMSVQLGFRGNMSIPENASEDEISFLKGTGIEYMQMPFEVRCNSFVIDFYPNGMPKEFRSNLTIIDDGKEVYTSDIIVNDPLYYKGIRIYQASFGDGGSDVQLKLYPMGGFDGDVREISTQVYTTFNDSYSSLSLEIKDFRPHNVENMANPGEAKDFYDLGPSVDFIIRGTDVKPVKIRSFLNAYDVDGDNRGSFMMVSTTGDVRDFKSVALGIDFNDPQEWALFNAFITQLGLVGDTIADSKLTAFKAAMKQVYGDQPPADIEEIGMRVLQATETLPKMPWSYLPVLENYEQKYYTGLQLARDPGMNVVWIGSALLVIGMCIMLYIAHRKLWVVIKPEGDGYGVTMAGISNRNPLNFDREFHLLLSKLDKGFASMNMSSDKTGVPE